MPKENHQLVLLNDNVNSFDDVMDSLVEVIGHNVFQAEQCATLIHHTGRCVIKYGNKTDLDFYSNLLSKDGLNVSVEPKL